MNNFPRLKDLYQLVSLNYQRELENREKETQMKEALSEWRQKGVTAFRQLVAIEQVFIDSSSPLPIIFKFHLG